MRGYRALTGALIRSHLREPVGFFFLLVFSPMLVLILGAVFGNAPAPEFGGHGFVDQMLPGIAVIAVLIVGIMTVPQLQLSLRETGALTRLRITPLRPRTFVAADLTVNFLLGLAGAVLTLVVGVVVFRVAAPENVALVLAGIVLGLLAMIAVGYTLAAILPSVAAATGLGNGLVILLMLTSGTMIPTEALPDGVRTIMPLSPVYHIAEIVRAGWQGAAVPWGSAAVLAGVLVVFGALGTALFRWDRAR